MKFASVLLIIAGSACSSGPQQEPPDSGPGTDSGVPDAGMPDAGSPDSGTPDDAGVGDTWTTWANTDFFAVYCDSCHTPGGPGDPSGAHFDFTQLADVASNAASIRCGTAVAHDPAWGCAASPSAKQFPIGTGAKPTDAERNRLAAWIDAGYPQ